MNPRNLSRYIPNGTLWPASTMRSSLPRILDATAVPLSGSIMVSLLPWITSAGTEMLSSPSPEYAPMASSWSISPLGSSMSSGTGISSPFSLSSSNVDSGRHRAFTAIARQSSGAVPSSAMRVRPRRM